MKATFAALGDVAEFINGAAFKPEDWGDEGRRIIRIQNLTDRSKPYNRTLRSVPDKFVVWPQDLLVSWSASLGVFVWDEPDCALLNQHIFRVVPTARVVEKRYLRHALQEALSEMQKHLHGATMQHVNRKEFLDTTIYLPSLTEQSRIASILDTADALRTKRRTAIEKLDTLPGSMFVDMFGDPTNNPRQFPLTKLGDLVDSDRGISYGVVQRGDDQDAGVPLIRISDITTGSVATSSIKYTQPEIAAKYRRTKLQGGELVISIRGTVGLVATVPQSLRDGNVTREIAVIPLLPRLSRAFFVHFLRTASVQRRLSADVKGIAQRGINLEDLRELEVPTPPAPLISEFEKRIAQFEQVQEISRGAMERTSGLWESLQQRAFRGEL